MSNFNSLPKLADISSSDLENRKVLVRLDTNVPIKFGRVVNGFRLEKSRPTLDWLRARKAKVIVIGHVSGGQSLKPVAEYFQPENRSGLITLAEATERVAKLEPGEMVFLENLRLDPGEEKNSRRLAKFLAGLGDIYVNDAFSVSHRRHVSIVGLPKLLPSYIGQLFDQEHRALSRALTPESPFVCLMGGAKFSTKLPLVKKFSLRADTLFVGGALAHTLFLRLGYSVGRSLVETGVGGLLPVLKRSNLMLPSDVVVKTVLGRKKVKSLESIRARDIIGDAGPATIEKISNEIKKAGFVLWNGPVGNFEAGFSHGTEEVAKAMAQSDAYTLIGGGDTVTAIEQLGLFDKVDFVSTAGGAMLEFLAKETLPGIEAILNSEH